MNSPGLQAGAFHEFNIVGLSVNECRNGLKEGSMTRRTKAFEIFYDELRSIVILRLRGCWDRNVGEQFEREFQDMLKAIHANGKEWYLLLDLTGKLPESQDMQHIVGRAIVSAKTEGMKNKAVLAKRFMPLFQAMKGSQDAHLHVDFYFQSEAEAIRWLLHEAPI